ncbi:MAG TPA: insulinase family protein, partial [Longimicrobiaceae bacterium]|nr:insulinase family protein [Longimicrobiaceae bacterium]
GAPFVVAPRLERAAVVLANRPGAVQSEVRVGHVGVPRDTPDYFPLTVMNALLGYTFSSRLNMNLRERLGYTYGASSQFAMRRRSGTFYVSAAVQSEGTAHSVEEVLREMREMRESEVTGPELDDARSYLAGVFPIGLQTTDGVAGKLSSLVTYGLPDDYWQSYRDRILAVTAAEVREAARARLHPDRAVAVVTGNAEQVRPSLEALGLPLIEVDPATELK